MISFLWPPDLSQATVEGHKKLDPALLDLKGCMGRDRVVQERSEPIFGHDQDRIRSTNLAPGLIPPLDAWFLGFKALAPNSDPKTTWHP